MSLQRPKLIEVTLPLDEINKHSVRENYIYRGNPSALHKWWAQRPLAACRAILFAQLVDDPSGHRDEFPTEEEQAKERERLHGIIKRLVVWENIRDADLLKEAYEEILKSCDGNPPAILEPFAGGGTIPIEAQRLGLEVYASDLNPVSVLINKALLEMPPRWADHHPVFPYSSKEIPWPGITGLIEDVRRYGEWMGGEAKDRIGSLYPKAEVSGIASNVIAWLWVRTVTCPNPACAGAMPLARSFELSKKRGRRRYAVPTLEGKRVRFQIGGPEGTPRVGTVGRNGAVCLICDTPVPLSYIRTEGKAGRMGAQLMATVTEGERQRYYIAPTEEQEKAAEVSRPIDVPDGEIPYNPRYLTTPNYGLSTWADLFTNRQLTALATFSDLIAEVRARAIADGAEPDYADAIACYLSFAISKTADYNCTGAVWYPNEDRPKNLFARQAIPMIWDYPEINVFANIGGTWTGCLRVVTEAMEGIFIQRAARAHVRQIDAGALTVPENAVTCTDPPYYDNVGYADLSDFFYVWLRRSLGKFFPDLLATLLTPKADELVADPVRNKNAEKFFEDGYTRVFARIRESSSTSFPITVFYAFKQSESDDVGGHASTGWETLLEGMLTSGWMVTATWPVRTERTGRIRDIGSNALASSIVLACRPRPTDAGFIDRRGFIDALHEELPDALRVLEQGKIAPVDLRQAAIGPGMAIFSRYAKVNEPDGSAMRVWTALSFINGVVDEVLEGTIAHVSADTRFCVQWFKQNGFDEGQYGTAETLSKGIDTSIEGLDRAGVLVSRAGKVRLLSVLDIPVSYDPREDDRMSEWEVCLHLAKRLADGGADAAASLMAAARAVGSIDLDDVRELAYLLYSIAEKRKWTETALLFNNLGTSWTDIEDGSRKAAVIAAANSTAETASGQGVFELQFGSDQDGDE